MGETKTKRMGGREVRIRTKEKPQPRTKERVPVKSKAEELLVWFKQSYPESEIVHRNNGIVYHLAGKKVVKEPVYENKRGLFFGRHLNRLLKDVPGVIPHGKSGVYKIPENVTDETIEAIQKAITSLHPPRQKKG